MAKLLNKIKGISKRKLTILIPENLIEEIESLSKQLNYVGKKSEFICLLLEHSLEELKKEIKRESKRKQKEETKGENANGQISSLEKEIFFTSKS